MVDVERDKDLHLLAPPRIWIILIEPSREE